MQLDVLLVLWMYLSFLSSVLLDVSDNDIPFKGILPTSIHYIRVQVQLARDHYAPDFRKIAAWYGGLVSGPRPRGHQRSQSTR